MDAPQSITSGSSNLCPPKDEKRAHGQGCSSMLLYKTPDKTDTKGPLSKLFLEQILKHAEVRIVEAQIVSAESPKDQVVHKITMLYREDIVSQQGKQDAALAGTIASLYKAGEMLDFDPTFFLHIENLKGNLNKYNLKNRNIIEFLIGFVLFTKEWNENNLAVAKEWLDYSKYALATVGSNVWLGDLCYLFARWEHGQAFCGDNRNYAAHLGEEYHYCDLSRKHCIMYREYYQENVSYKIIIRTAKMVQLTLDLPVHHKRFTFKQEPALQQVQFCTIGVTDLKDAESLQQEMRKEVLTCQSIHQPEAEFYIKFDDIYILIRKVQLLALGDLTVEDIQTSDSVSARDAVTALPGICRDDHRGRILSDFLLEYIEKMTTQAINICEELLGNKKYKQKSTYKDVLGWLQGTIKPYLQNFNLRAFCVQNRQFPAGQWCCEPCDMETPDSSDSLNSV